MILYLQHGQPHTFDHLIRTDEPSFLACRLDAIPFVSGTIMPLLDGMMLRSSGCNSWHTGTASSR